MLLSYLLAVAAGGLLGAGIGYLLSKYLETAIEWFKTAWRSISRSIRAVGILYRRGKRLFKAIVVELIGGETEIYEPTGGDDGVEVTKDDMSPEAWNFLQDEDYLPIERYGY